ncbi:MAG TPA: hypothetical protein PK096_00435 [Candidatus Saccharibacteria bacterium]|nr:hypothetical protein [Candidatus Saccharibacteria bacterium]HRK93823.1 hypothetical protein [Candidatus Saccharibacteria bacterium]
MPGVDVYYEADRMEEPVADVIKMVVSGFGQVEFSTSALRLGPDDFSFKFHKPNTKFDRLSHNIIVRIRLDDCDERVERVDDAMAKSLAHDIRQLLRDHFSEARIPTIGVELMLSNISWGAANGPRSTRRGRVMAD